ncbi:MAG: hypothetical protein LBQ83_07040 [Candidatus Margulisbacteria bacterium]|jgi:hypothetical protein|nr:hypothetical protein [Candidatus Margulisiibacteriota bacterium]
MNTKTITSPEKVITSRPAFLLYGGGLGFALGLLVRGCLLPAADIDHPDQSASGAPRVLEKAVEMADEQNSGAALSAPERQGSAPVTGSAADIPPQRTNPRNPPKPLTPLMQKIADFNYVYETKYLDFLIAIKTHGNTGEKQMAEDFLNKVNALDELLKAYRSDAEKIDFLSALEKDILNFLEG